jgi:hypothetical protein
VRATIKEVIDLDVFRESWSKISHCQVVDVSPSKYTVDQVRRVAAVATLALAISQQGKSTISGGQTYAVMFSPFDHRSMKHLQEHCLQKIDKIPILADATSCKK